MSLFDSFKQAFNKAPETKAATVPVGGYEGAQNYSTDRSYLYATGEESFGDAPAYARSELLRLTRYLVNNYAVVERILTVCENYAVGVGISAQASTLDSIFNDGATTYFEDWARSPFSTTSNELNLYDIQKLIVRELLIAGEIFLVMTKSDSGFPQLIPVSSEQVRHSGKKNDKSVDGLYVDNFGKVNAYQIYFSDKPSRIEASNVIHIKRIKNINQRRGVSAFAASINSLRDHRDLQILEKKAVKVHAALAATVTKKTGEAGDGLFNNGVTKKQTVAGNQVASRNGALEKAFGGAVAYLAEGEQVTLIESNRSTDGFLKFLEVLMRDVCMNISLPYEFAVNPSALTSAGIRFIIQDSDILFKNLQSLVIDSGLQRIYSWVIASGIKAGKIPNSSDVRYYSCNWVKPQSITIDSGRKDRTELEFIDNGLTSMDAFYASRGLMWKDELRQIAQEKAYIKSLESEYGVSFKAEAGPAPLPSEPQAEEETTAVETKE